MLCNSRWYLCVESIESLTCPWARAFSLVELVHLVTRHLAVGIGDMFFTYVDRFVSGYVNGVQFVRPIVVCEITLAEGHVLKMNLLS